MTRRLPSFFFQERYLTIIGLITISFLSFGLSQSFAQTVITMDTGNSSYGPGDMVKISGHVSNSPNKLVAVQVKDPGGNTIVVRTVKTDGIGNFVLEFKLPSTAKTGSYNIIANANVDGNIVTQTKEIAETTTVPEFPFATIILLVSIVSMITCYQLKFRGKV